jgi:hypothetical protein
MVNCPFRLYGALGGLVSGHTLKHILAAIAGYTVLAMLRATSKGRVIR